MKQIDTLDGHAVFYNKKTDTVESKEVVIPLQKIIDAMSSSFDRVSIQKDIVLRKFPMTVQLGCYTLPKEKMSVKNLKQLRCKE